jgi:2-iminoacetate synthase ThiH
MWDDVRAVVQDPRSLEQLLAAATPATAARLTQALDGGELSAADGEALLDLGGDDLSALVRAADAARTADVGEGVT